MSNQLELWMFVAARCHGDFGRAILDFAISSLESASTVFVSTIGELKATKLRSAAIIVTTKRTRAQPSHPSLSLFCSLPVVASLINGIISLLCEDEWHVSCLIRTSKIDSTPCDDAYDYGWVFSVSNFGIPIAMSLFRIMYWIKNNPLNCEVCNGQRFNMHLALAGQPRWSLFRMLDCCFVMMLGPLRFYGAFCPLLWIGYCWVFPLRICKILTLDAQVKWQLHCIYPYYSGFPCCTSMLFNEIQWIMTRFTDWDDNQCSRYKAFTLIFLAGYFVFRKICQYKYNVLFVASEGLRQYEPYGSSKAFFQTASGLRFIKWVCKVYFLLVNLYTFTGFPLLTEGFRDYCRYNCSFGWHSVPSIFLGNGFRIVLGSAVKQRVAPRSGEQPWLIAPGYNLPFLQGYMMSISLSVIFRLSFNPSIWVLEVVRFLLYGFVSDITSFSVRNSLFIPQMLFGFFHSSRTGTYAWDNEISGPSILLFDVTSRKWLNCFPGCSKVEYLTNENILFLPNYFILFDFIVVSFFCPKSNNSPVVKPPPESAHTYWWSSHAVSKPGDGSSGCIRLQIQQLQTQQLFQGRGCCCGSRSLISLWNFSVFCSPAVAHSLCRSSCLCMDKESCLCLAMELLLRSAVISWLTCLPLRLPGEVPCSCRSLQIKHISHSTEDLDWIGNSSFFCYCRMSFVLVFSVTLFSLMCMIDHLINKKCSMVSEDIWQFKPYDTSKAYLSTAYGLRLLLDYCFAWFGIILWLSRTICRTLVEQFTLIDMYFNEDN